MPEWESQRLDLKEVSLADVLLRLVDSASLRDLPLQTALLLAHDWLNWTIPDQKA